MIYNTRTLFLLFTICCFYKTTAQVAVLKELADSAVTKSMLTHDYQVLHLSLPLKKQDVQALGYKIMQPIDNENYIVAGSNYPASNLLKSATYSLKPAGIGWKLSSYLKSHDTTDETGRFAIKVWEIEVFKKDVGKIASQVKIVSMYTGSNSLIIETTYKCLLAQIVQMGNVVHAELYSTLPMEESEVIDHNLVINNVNQMFHNYPAMNGNGITISVKENKYDTADIDLRGRHVPSPLSGPNISSHPTIMATIAAGGGNTSVKNKGIAWGANITSSYFLNLLPDEDKYFDGLSVSVQNHSYGTQVESFYGTLAQAYDICANHNPLLVHVFSIGNNGQYTDTIGPYRGINTFANITGNYKQAKNIITVGSVDLSYVTDPKVSKGPAYDGRVKPELVSFSTFGSSNSAAIVSGVVAALQQAYKQDNGNQLPPSALLKAILFTSAEDIGPKGIDYYSGYGNVNASHAMNNLKGKLYFSGTLNQNEEKNFNLSIPEKARNLKITLVWNDPAAEPNASKALVNDLDLELYQDNTGISWKPWFLNSYPHADSLQQLPQRKADRLNNAEQITIDKPEPGTYTVKVSAYDLPVTPQDFFIAYQWDLDESFSWTFPTGTDNFLYYNSVLSSFRWKSTFADHEQGRLEISTDKGNTWELISDTISLSEGNYYWQIPEIFTKAIARMAIKGQRFLSDTFTISSFMDLKVGFNCGDSVMLQWNHADNAISYTLYSLGEKYMEPIQTITDTAVILKKFTYQTKLFAIAPNFSKTIQGLRSFTYNYDLQGVNCYFISFIANNIEAKGIQLTLNLGSTYKISKIIFESWNNQQFVPIHTIQNGSSTNEIYTDDTPLQGIDIYRARLELENGTTLISDPDTVYFLTQTPVLIFPNPIRQNETLNIYTQYEASQSAIFKLYDITGKLMATHELVSDQESVVLKTINKGIYLYQLEMNGSVQTGKIVVY